MANYINDKLCGKFIEYFHLIRVAGSFSSTFVGVLNLFTSNFFLPNHLKSLLDHFLFFRLFGEFTKHGFSHNNIVRNKYKKGVCTYNKR